MGHKEIEFVSYLCSWEEMVETWVDVYHPSDVVLIVFDPDSHKEYLEKVGFDFDELRMYNSKIGVIQLLDIDDGLWVLKNVPNNGPYIQLWARNKYISDNVDKQLFTLEPEGGA